MGPASADSLRVLADSAAVVPQLTPTDPHTGFGGYTPGTARSPARAFVEWESLWNISATGSIALQRRLALVWPARRDLHFQCAARTMWAWQEDPDAALPEQRTQAALETMRDPDETLGPGALRLIARALAIATPNRGIAAAVITDAITTRRLDPTALGRALAGTDAWRAASLNRVANSLRPVADAGPLERHELQLALEALLAALGDRQPSLGRVLWLLHQLAIDADAAVRDPAARAWLEGVADRSRLKPQARAILDVSGNGTQRSIAAAAQAREAEREIAQRWGRDPRRRPAARRARPPQLDLARCAPSRPAFVAPNCTRARDSKRATWQRTGHSAPANRLIRFCG